MPVVRRLLPAAPVPTVVLTTVVLAVALAGLTGCDSGSQALPAAPASESSTPLQHFDTTTLALARHDFCPRVAPDAVERALGAAPARSTSYVNGERARLAPSVADVAHEFGCTWAGHHAVARAWVFAPPVTVRRALALRAEARHQSGCRPLLDAPRFGSPTAAVACRASGQLTVAFHGLFGDAWLSCTIQVPAARTDSTALADRTGRWCVAVAQADAA